MNQADRVYLLTGASGVVGSAIVPELLRLSDAHILLLLRAKGSQPVTARLDQLKVFWRHHYPDLPAEAFDQRLSAVAGEITEPALGLDSADRERLANDCTNIIHCAASVRMNLPLEEARRTARFPVESVLTLGRACRRLRKVEFVSTVGVGGHWDGPLPERWINEPRSFHNTYEAAKAEAETLIETAVAEGFPATVHRPSMVIGNALNGAVIHFQIFYFICDFLSGRRTLGLYPRLDTGLLDVIPNDFVGRAIAVASLDDATRGRIFHLCAGPARAVPLPALRAVVRRLFRDAGRIGYLPRVDVSAASFSRLMHAVARFLPERDRRAIDTLPIYLDYLAGVQEFGNDATLATLATHGVELPDINGAVTRCLAYYLASSGKKGP